jgi:hypothetical protein
MRRLVRQYLTEGKSQSGGAYVRDNAVEGQACVPRNMLAGR